LLSGTLLGLEVRLADFFTFLFFGFGDSGSFHFRIKASNCVGFVEAKAFNAL